MLLVAFKGMPGTGKSTLARALARKLRWPLIDKDDIKDVLDAHIPASGGLAYETMYSLVRRQVLLGLDVFCDSPLTFERCYVQLRAIAAEANATLLIIESRCSARLRAGWQGNTSCRERRSMVYSLKQTFEYSEEW